MLTVIVLILLLILAAVFFAGYALGARRQNRTSGQVREPDPRALGRAWQEGYEAAMNFVADRDSPPVRAAKSPIAEQPPVPAGNGIPRTTPPVIQASGAAVGPGHPTAEPPSAQQLEEARIQRELRNINITLYVAALLIVSACGLFLSFALPQLAKLICLYLVTVAAYAGGLIIHARKHSLRPAATAFTGTGLALLPLSGIATYNMLEVSGPVIWLIFSGIGTLAVGYATLRLRSRVLSWVAVLILVSTALAGAATLQRGLLYHLLALVGLSILLLLSATTSQRVRGSIFYRALSSTGQLLPALVALLAALMPHILSSRDYLWIFVLLTVQLLLQVRLFSEYRSWRLYAARATGSAAVVSACLYLEIDPPYTASILALVLAIQGVLVVRFARVYRKRLALAPNAWRLERGVLWMLTFCSLASAFLASTAGQTAWWSYVAVPVFMVFTVPALLRGLRIEAGALLVLSLLPLLDTLDQPWRALPSLALGIAGLTLVRGRATRRWAELLDQARWVLSLLGGVLLARSAALWLGDDAPRSLFTASLVGLWLPLFGYWAADLSGLGRGGWSVIRRWSRLLRVGLSTVLALGTTGLARVNIEWASAQDSFLGLGLSGWFTAGLLITVVLIALSGWVGSADDNWSADRWSLPRAGALAALALAYLLSFERTWWYVAVLVAAVAVVYALLQARRAAEADWRIIHAGAAQIFFSSASWWVVDCLGFDAHGQFAWVLLSLTVPQLIRMIWRRRAGAMLTVEIRGIAMGLLVLIPVGSGLYAVLAGGGDRGVLLLATTLWGVYGLAAFLADSAVDKARQFYLYPALTALSLLAQIPAWSLRTDTGWIRGTWWDEPIACTVLAVLAAAGLAWEYRSRSVEHLGFATGWAIWCPLALIALNEPTDAWQLGLFFAVALVFAVLVHTRTVSWYALGASLFLCLGALKIISMWRAGQPQPTIESMDVVWALLGVGLVLFLLASAHGRFGPSPVRYPRATYRALNPVTEAGRLYFAAMLGAILGAGLLLHLGEERVIPVLGGALLILAVAVACRFFELPDRAVPFASDGLGILAALLALGSYVRLVQVPDPSLILAYLSLVAVVLAVRRQRTPLAQLERIYTLSAAVLASLALVTTLSDDNSLSQVYALAFFVGLIIWGLKAGKRLYIWWGAVAVTLAVLWMLRSLAFLWLVLLGLALIVAAVLKLLKVDAGGTPRSTEPNMTPGPQDQASAPEAPTPGQGQEPR